MRAGRHEGGAIPRIMITPKSASSAGQPGHGYNLPATGVVQSDLNQSCLLQPSWSIELWLDEVERFELSLISSEDELRVQYATQAKPAIYHSWHGIMLGQFV